MRVKGQVTLYVIFGLVILLTLIFLVILFSGPKTTEQSKINRISQDYTEAVVTDMVERCLKSSLLSSTYAVGLHGGYIDSVPSPVYGEIGTEHIQYDSTNISLLLNRSRNNLLSMDELSVRLCRKAYVDLQSCLNFSELELLGISVDQPFKGSGIDSVDQNCKAVLKNDSISLKVYYPVIIYDGGLLLNASIYQASAPIRIGPAYRSVERIVSVLVSNYSTYNITRDCSVYDTNNKTNIFLKNNNKVIQIVDYDAKERMIMPTAFIFQFAIEGHNIVGGCS